MKKITLQKAIFLLSTLVEKERNLRSNLFNYKMPLAVNGKEILDEKNSKKMLEEVSKIESIQRDIFELKTKINKANSEVNIDGSTLSALLEEVRLKRGYLATLKNLLQSGNYTKVENSVGVVQYGVLNEEIISDKVEKLEDEVFNISQKIDEINASLEIEVTIENEK